MISETKRALEAIAPSEFETLVLEYLAATDSDLLSLIQTGINDEGKPINCKVDAIRHLPGTPSRCVGVASTTTSRNKLRAKWKEDIHSAWEEFNKYRNIEPDIVCTLYLASNRSFENDTQLHRSAIAEAKKYGIRLQFVEASMLVRFLDNDTDGQFIRQRLFGINVQRLGIGLLRQIGHESLAQHWTFFGLDFGLDTPEITRDVQSQLIKVIAFSGASLIGIRGVSGTGKSTLARQIGEYLNSSSNVVIWVPAEHINPARPLLSVLIDVLRPYAPSLHADLEFELKELLGELPEPIILLIDDVNKL